MDSYEILNSVYLMQSASDPNHGPEDMAERMAEIYRLACYVMEKTGFNPDGY